MKLWILITAGCMMQSLAMAMDVATEHTQILNNIELISENLRQLQSLENQIAMIKNQVEGLKSVANYQGHFNDIDVLRNNLTTITTQGAVLSSKTQEILAQIQDEINAPVEGDMVQQQQYVDRKTLGIVHNTLSRVAQMREEYQLIVDSVNELMGKNNQSLGETQALQTSNELAAQNIGQAQATQELLSEEISMQAAMMTKQLQEENDEDNKMKQIFNAEDDGSFIFGGSHQAQ